MPDGRVPRFAFDGHSVRYRNRFVRTREYVAEERAGRMLFRSFGTNVPGGLRRNLLRLRGDSLCEGDETCATCALDCAVCPPPACTGTIGGWDGCRGNGCAVCTELLLAYPRYFENHVACVPNVTCAAVFFTCYAACPAPTPADM